MASSSLIIIPKDYPEGERFKESKYKFEAGAMRNIVYNGIKTQIFNSDLMAFFATPGFELKFSDGEPIPKKDLFRAYVEGYSEGMEKFKQMYSVPPAIVFSNPKPYIETLHEACFHCDPITKKEDFAWVRKVSQFPIHLTGLKYIREKGFYAGLYASVEELRAFYPRSFTTFEECHLEKNGSSPEGLNNFEKAVWYEYLRKAGYKQNLTATEKKTLYCKNFELAYNDYDKKRRKPTEAESLKIIAALEEYPNAYKAAQNNFDLYETL